MISTVFGRTAQFFLALVMMRIATTILTPEEIGKVSLVSTTISFFSLLLINPPGVFINRRLHEWEKTGSTKYYLLYYIFYLGCVAFFSGIILIFLSTCDLIDFGVPLKWLIFLVFTSLIFNIINLTAISALNLLGHRRLFLLLSILTLLASALCAILLTHIIQPLAQYWLFGLLLGQALFGFIGGGLLFFRLNKPSTSFKLKIIEKKYLKLLFGFSWPIAIAAILIWVQGQSYRYLLETYVGTIQFGLFIAGYGVSAGMIAGFESILTSYFLPEFYKDISSEKNNNQLNQAWYRYVAAFIPSLILTVAFIAALAPELTQLFLGMRFQSSMNYVILGAFAESVRVLINVYSLISHVNMDTRRLIFPSIIGAILSVLLCGLLIPRLGIVGAGVGLLVSGFVIIMMMHLMLTWRSSGGMPIQLITRAFICAGGMWLAAFILRYFSDESSLIIFSFMTITYLCLQYLFLKKHIKIKH